MFRCCKWSHHQHMWLGERPGLSTARSCGQSFRSWFNYCPGSGALVQWTGPWYARFRQSRFSAKEWRCTYFFLTIVYKLMENLAKKRNLNVKILFARWLSGIGISELRHEIWESVNISMEQLLSIFRIHSKFGSLTWRFVKLVHLHCLILWCH